MTSDAEHLFMCLLAICYLLREMSVWYFAHLLIGPFVFLLLSHNTLYILGPSPSHFFLVCLKIFHLKDTLIWPLKLLFACLFHR